MLLQLLLLLPPPTPPPKPPPSPKPPNPPKQPKSTTNITTTITTTLNTHHDKQPSPPPPSPPPPPHSQETRLLMTKTIKNEISHVYSLRHLDVTLPRTRNSKERQDKRPWTLRPPASLCVDEEGRGKARGRGGVGSVGGGVGRSAGVDTRHDKRRSGKIKPV
ncbi:hypothetical protein E2C01_088802 [Portunus trituberculatus]|uniref:Uncharacterized protein n=1 Tax=Portunus trituberculatus TaxID=210409 RepID=A0A5B7JGG0_PORTR|nr:hypothetical protein [Portunus trituberculatus]